MFSIQCQLGIEVVVIINYCCFIYQVLLANRLDEENHFKYTAITVPLFISLLTLIGLSFGAKGGNHCKFMTSR